MTPRTWHAAYTARAAADLGHVTDRQTDKQTPQTSGTSHAFDAAYKGTVHQGVLSTAAAVNAINLGWGVVPTGKPSRYVTSQLVRRDGLNS